MRTTFPLIVLAAVLVACQTAVYRGNIDSPYYTIPPGSSLTLTQDLKFGPDQLSVYVQNGNVLSLSQLQVYSPFCKFELNHPSASARTIVAGQISVTKAFQYRIDSTFSSLAPPRRTQLVAATSIAQMGGGEPAGGPPLYSYVTRMDLRSDAQPEIFRMSCARWGYPGMEEHVTIAEMQRTLSPLFTLRTPAEG